MVDESGKNLFFSKPSLALSYHVSENVKKSLVDGKLVALYKLLPGFNTSSDSEISAVTSDGNGVVKFKLGDSSKDKKLAR